MPAAKDRFTLPPVITGSTWANVVDAALTSRRGTLVDSESDNVPRFTNREALSLVMGLRLAAYQIGWPLWYQFAAAAYSWDGGDVLASEPDGDYDADASGQLALEARRIARELDAGQIDTTREPRLQLADVYASEATKAAVMEALRGDGAQASFKIPLLTCKDSAGKRVRPIYDKKTKKLRCPDGTDMVTIDDPITAIIKKLAPAAVPLLIVAAVWYGVTKRRDRRRRD